MMQLSGGQIPALFFASLPKEYIPEALPKTLLK
jgi:hypothetical protein